MLLDKKKLRRAFEKRETSVETILVRAVRKLGWLCIKFKDHDRKGAPDRMVLTSSGDVFFVELKRQKGKLRQHQVTYSELLSERGFEVYVCYCKEDVEFLVLDKRAGL